jgi:hypothetical protein
MGRDETALGNLRRAYTELNGNDDGLEEYLWSTRNQLARKVDDFALPTYDGEVISLSGLAGKVVLLNFWSPG